MPPLIIVEQRTVIRGNIINVYTTFP